MAALVLQQETAGGSAHPNFFDQRRIERALEGRKRYRYVQPSVVAIADGYRIESPCCSRNVDPKGGVVDVALFQFDSVRATWQLFRKDHVTRAWVLHSSHGRLVELLETVSEDTDRQFWQ